MLKKLDRVCRSIHRHATLTGIDANRHILEFARKEHFRTGGANLVMADVIHQPELIPRADVYMLNLFLHHFEMNEIKILFDHLIVKKPDLLVVNDLQRSKLAYVLFTFLCKLKQISKLTFHDGQLSITKGFNKKEMRIITEMAKGYHYHLSWNWAFKWQLVMARNPDYF